MKAWEVKIKKEIEELFLKQIIVSVDGMDTFGKKEMKKMRPIKNSWYDRLINYIPEPIAKIVGGFKDKIVSLFITNTPKKSVYKKKMKKKKKKKQKKNHLYKKRTKNK